jgi:hypothetical protein
MVAAIEKTVALKPGDAVLDIGSNDGTLLSAYSAGGIDRVGIDPTIAGFRQYYPADVIKLDAFFTEQNFRRVYPSGRARAITSIAMFYDLPDPNMFVSAIGKILADDGIWILEQSYLPSMVERNAFDTICHEHLEYYALRQIISLMKRHGLRVFDVSLNDVNGGSFQVWVCHENAGYRSNTEVMSALLQKEDREGYASGAPILALKERVEQIRNRILTLLQDLKRQGKRVHGYGASTKGNTLLQFFGIGPDLIPVIADRNNEKFGRRTPGTAIPIISEQASRAQRPDYYFVLPWHFKDSFLAREREFCDRGGKFIFPLPVLEIVP